MTASQEIVEYAESLFDVVGIGQLPGGEPLLLVGLESTPQRNLDEFGHRGGRFQMYGFRKHAGPGLRSLLAFIRGKGFLAELIGRYGYPLRGEVNLKEVAIRAGLGKRGKSTVVLHPEYGPRLRFMAISTDAPLEAPESSILAEEENPVCDGCSICLDVCPADALEPYRLPDISICLSNETVMNEEGRSVLCDLCLHQCPAGTEK